MSDNSAPMRVSGPGAAAVLAAAIGGFALGILALAADASPALARILNFWNPTGPLSGVTDIAIAVWFLSWFALSRRWVGRNPYLQRINVAAAVLLGVGLLLTFPPFMDLLQGK
ncbi:MAG: hypothetical protein ABSF96_00555 [Steroidobacteraceae bacterium]|jgi:hypothetical protein